MYVYLRRRRTYRNSAVVVRCHNAVAAAIFTYRSVKFQISHAAQILSLRMFKINKNTVYQYLKAVLFQYFLAVQFSIIIFLDFLHFFLKHPFGYAFIQFYGSYATSCWNLSITGNRIYLLIRHEQCSFITFKFNLTTDEVVLAKLLLNDMWN